MLYFSSLLQTTPTYKPAADRLFAALDLYGLKYTFINQTKDIWLRDFMPVKTKNGTYSSFRYEPSYLKAYPQLQTDYRREVAEQFSFPVTYSAVNLDGGNVVFSPSKAKALLSDRVFAENPSYAKAALVRELERLLEAQRAAPPGAISTFWKRKAIFFCPFSAIPWIAMPFGKLGAFFQKPSSRSISMK